jgi:multidrug efflux system membrane fusion protein
MTTLFPVELQFLAEWALRSSILILSGALLLWALRVKDPSIRLAAWTAMLCGSLAIPVLTAALPKAPLAIMRAPSGRVEAPAAVQSVAFEPMRAPASPNVVAPERFDWARAAVAIYVLVALALLLRLCIGLAMSLRLLRSSLATGQATHGIPIRESNRVATPVTLGIARPAIVLPGDWRQWDAAKLDAVLAHERSHIRRHDPAVQLLSAIHRVLLWHSPLSWFLHRRIVCIAEEASDDAAVTVTRDRAFYAEVVLDFIRRAPPRTNWQGVPMARYGRADERIHRILDGTALSRGVTRWSVAVILVLGVPLAYLVAAAQPQAPPQAQAPTPAPPVQVTTEKLPASDALPVKVSIPKTRKVSVAAQSAANAEAGPLYLNGLGNVSPYTTVIVRPRVDGQLMSVSFTEGGLVQAGQLLASIDPQPYQLLVTQAEGQLARDQAQLVAAAEQLRRLRQMNSQSAIPKEQLDTPAATVAQLDGVLKTDQAKLDNAKLQLSYAQVRAPITGVVGLRLVDPGNIVHATDTTGIVIINQLQPISVLFALPEDSLPQVLARLRQGATPPVEAWTRDSSAKIASGRLVAVDNQIDIETGTAKFKAVFDNKDSALFPNEFVNVRLNIR